jgi:hypothetical protein
MEGAALAAFAGSSGCVARAPAVADAPGRRVGEQPERWARLAEPLDGGAVRFALSRPAYVAIFAVTPGEGVRLVYPASARQNVLVARGSYTRAMRRDLTTPVRVTRLRPGYGPEMRYLYMIASDQPLRLEEPLRWPDGGMFGGASLGDRAFDPRSYAVDRTFEALFDLVVPDTGSAQVDTDVLAYYPDVRFRRSGRTVALSAFQCYDGRVVYVPASYRADYFPASWYGVDFQSGQYVGSECYTGYFTNAQSGSGTGQTPVVRPRAPGDGPRLEPGGSDARDVRPSIPLDATAFRPIAPGPVPSAAPAGERDGDDPVRAPRFEPRARSPEPREVTPSAPQASEPRERPTYEPPPRSEPVHSDPVRSEPVRSEPVRSEPVRSEPVRGEGGRPEPVRPSDPGERG